MAKHISMIASLLLTSSVYGQVITRVGDVTSLKGQGVNYLTGMGLVVGLAGTGDGDDYALAMRPLAKALGFHANPVATMDDLADTKNVAIVFLEATLPANGTREGSRIDVKVSAFGSAKSLRGGRLLPAPLVYPDRNVEIVFATAAGPIQLNDPVVETTGVVSNGAVIQEDVVHVFTANGSDLPFSSGWIEPDGVYVTLVIGDEHASWSLAREIAQAIDSAMALSADVEHVAMAVDPKNVLVYVPPIEADNPADWISQVEGLDLLIASSESRVVVSRNSGSIVVSGNAKISPVIVSHRGLTISIAAPVEGAPPDVIGSALQNFVAVDPSKAGGGNVADLLEALNRLSVPIEDRIAILTQIHSMGALHAQLIVRE